MKTWLQRVDHVTYAVAAGRIETWANVHMALAGGDLVTRIDDVDPQNAASSMKLWCIRYPEFGIALVEGIDREQKSQVTTFVEAHGDHSAQHVAYAVDDLEEFLAHLATLDVRLRGEPMIRRDGFGMVKQVFTKGFAQGDPAAAMFLEFVERPRGDETNVSFSGQAGRGFYQQIEDARASNDVEAMVDLGCFRQPKAS